MPNGHPTIVTDDANAPLASVLREFLGGSAEDGPDPDLLVVTGVPRQSASHVVITGPLTDEVDVWDRDVPPQTLAGALWVTAEQDRAAAIEGWWLLRRETPTTPLSDLTDDNDRALRWSVVGAVAIDLPMPGDVLVDEQEVREWLDEQPQIQALGAAVDRIGGDSAEAVLKSVTDLRDALRGLAALAASPDVPVTGDLDAAVAEHLRQVQRSGFGRWRGGRARADSQAALAASAKQLAGDRLRELIDVRRQELETDRREQEQSEHGARARDLVARAAASVDLPLIPDFEKVPRSWSGQPPAARRYALVAEQHADLLTGIEGVTLRTTEGLPAGMALCLVVQSGFSLPALR